MQRSALIDHRYDNEHRPEQDHYLYLFWRWISVMHFSCIPIRASAFPMGGGSNCKNSHALSGNLTKYILAISAKVVAGG